MFQRRSDRKLSASYSGEDLKTALKEIQELTDEGMLFTEDIYENAIEHFERTANCSQSIVPAYCPTTVIWPVSTALRKKENIMEDVH